MSLFPSPTAELTEGKANLTAEITATEEAGARKERSLPQPALEASLNHLKPTPSTTSEEDASDKKPADQTAAIAATEALEKISKSGKVEAGSDAIAGRGVVDTTTANRTDAQLDSKSKEKAESEEQDQVFCGEENSNEDSQDTNNSGEQSDESDSVVYTAERQYHDRRRAKSRVKHFGPYLRSVEHRMKLFEEELEKLKGDNTIAKAKPQLLVEKSSSLVSEIIKTTSPAVSEIIPSIRRMNWADFKPSERSQDSQELSQRFTWDRLKIRANLQEGMESKPTKVSDNQQHGTPGAMTKHQHHVIEVLVEDPGASKRRRSRKHTDDGTIRTDSSQKGDNTIRRPSSVTETPILQCPERVRICSRPLLRIVYRLIDPERRFTWDALHTVFLRPFKLFVLYEAEIRVALKNLEKRWQPMGQTTPIEQTSGRKNGERKTEAGKSNDTDSQNDDTTPAEVSPNPVVKTDTFEALKHLRLLVEFLDNDLRSTFTLRKQINARKDCPIAFSDLWHLYEHGQEVRTPNVQIQVYRVARFTGGRDLVSESVDPNGPFVSSSCIERQGSKGAFFVECYSYDFNGTQYGPVHTMFEIRRYEGLRYITSLPVYPLWFDSDHQKERIRLARRGEKFMALAQINRSVHKSYRGLSLDEHAEEVSWSMIFPGYYTKQV